jgi:uncharacterized protein (TIGR03435 family)
MLRAFVAIGSVILLSGAVFGQSAATPPAFELADVHAVAGSTRPYASGGVLRGSRYDVRNATMVDLISMAYSVEGDKVLGGPSWLESDRFDVLAKAPPKTPPETLQMMLQALLADRFKLVVHNDSKPLPVFVLSLGKGKPKIKEAEGSGNPGCQGVPQNPEPGSIPYAVVACRNMTMEMFALNLRGMANAYINSPVIDSTGLKGLWDIDLKWTARGLLSQAGADGISIFDAVDKQLGLKLEPQKVPTKVIVVDSVNQKPTDNPAGVTEKLPPPPPAEFEVADIKPSKPDAKQNGRLLNGRIDLEAFTLKSLITLAWDINSDEMLAGAPKFLDSARFDVVAKVSSDGQAPQVDIDALRLMLRALLVDRFKMVTHTEDRPVNAYTLVAVKPKLKPADPSNRMGWKEGPPPGVKDPRDANPVLSRFVNVQNMTMAQFAAQLQNMASGYIHSPVVDATGLEGAWDFTLNFSPIGLLQGGGRGGAGQGGQSGQPAGAAPLASDPSGALSLFDAVSKQLGLKLELQKRPMPVLVIDHVEEKPTDN